jgi:peptide/nickel transport system substrate-binding protein
VVGSGGALALATACGRRTTAPGGTAASSNSQPHTGGTLRIWVQHDPTDWATSTGTASPQMEGRELAYNGLLKFQTGSQVPFDSLTVQPELAESWESPDDQTYTFHLRKNLRFADLPPFNGRALTAADVQWSYQYQAESGQFMGKKLPPSVFAWMFAGMNSVTTPDDNTVVIRFDKPYAPWLNYAATGGTFILGHEIFDADGDFKKQIVGAGPWQLDVASVQTGTRYVWRRNQNFWKQQRPYIDQLAWIILRDDATGYAAFQSSQVDLLNGGPGGITKLAAERLRQGVPDAVAFDRSGGAYILEMNVSRPPLDDVRLRRALRLGIDWQGIQQGAQNITGSPGALGLAGAMPDTFAQDEIKALLKYDPTQAKQLLAAAGHAEGIDLEVIFNGDAYGDAFTSMLQLVQAQVKKVGINLTLHGLDGATKNTRMIQHNFVVLAESDQSSADIDTILYRRFYPIPGGNDSAIDDPQLSRLIDAQRQEKDATQRRAIARQAVQLIHDQAYSLVLCLPTEEVVWRSRLQGFAPNAGFGGWPLGDSWIAS